MNNSTKQFSWKNRASAAQDLLQLVYHAPPYISQMSARLLTAIRSIESLPQLRDIVLDDKIDKWTRIYALRAIANLPTNILIEEFTPLMQLELSQNEILLLQRQMGWAEPALLFDFTKFVDEQPDNRRWFFELLDKAHPVIVTHFIRSAFYHAYSDDFKQLLATSLLKVLETDSTLLDMNLVSNIVRLEISSLQSWLDSEFDTVLELCLKNPEDSSVVNTARQWKRLRVALQDRLDGWHVHLPLSRHRRKKNTTNYQTSPAYLYLWNLYDRAKDSDSDAYQKLRSIALKWQGNIPMRAVATHWIGKLSGIYDVFPTLAYQMKYGNVNWKMDLFDSPIRYEAGLALLQFKAPETWEVFVDSYFISPGDDLLPFQSEWIAYLTDYLSGEVYEYNSIHFGGEENRWWFRNLENVSMDDMR